jgi:hypothetical protein
VSASARSCSAKTSGSRRSCPSASRACSKPRGKFAGKPILHPEHLERRRRFLPLYFGIWALVVGHFVWAIAQRWS